LPSSPRIHYSGNTKNGAKKDDHAVFNKLAATHITEEEAGFNYQDKLRKKNSVMALKWLKKKTVTYQTEDETIRMKLNIFSMKSRP